MHKGIKTSDVMLGNLMQDQDGNILQVSEITDNNIVYKVLDRTKFPLKEGWKAVPISLTEDILIKAGFEKVNRNGELYFLNGDCFELHQFNQYGHFSYTCGDNLKGNFVSIRIDHIHQIQNLYFAVTGKELEVNRL